jgi:hypothetical protein
MDRGKKHIDGHMHMNTGLQLGSPTFKGGLYEKAGWTEYLGLKCHFISIWLHVARR